MSVIQSHQERQAERLTDAFRLFNQLSQNLNDSYQNLEQQVAGLTRELAATRSERLKILTEKEKIAARLQQILTALPAAIIVLNAQETIIDCNRPAMGLLGEPLLGLDWSDVMKRSLLPVFDTPHERQLRDGRRVHITRSFVNNHSGQIVLLSDVSELRDLQEMLERQKQLSAMGEMVASMAHQVRTPLATAILYASQMNKPNVTEARRRRFTSNILESLHHLERQVNGMLTYAKQGKLAMDAFSLRHLLSRIEQQMADVTDSFDLDNGASFDRMLGNEDALRGALMNILHNAVEASHEGGRIGMRVSSVEGESVTFRISDQGEGMSLHRRQRLFEPFFTTKAHGTGLGLAIVNSVVKAHGGTIQCDSAPGEGTVFTLQLPCINQHSITLSGAATAVVNG